jgi:hypothetical protein
MRLFKFKPKKFSHCKIVETESNAYRSFIPSINRYKSIAYLEIKINIQLLNTVTLIFIFRTSDYPAIREVLPNAKFISIAETGHYLHIERPNEFIDNLVSFINS